MALTEQLRVLITGEGQGLITEFEKVGNAARKAHADIGNSSKDAAAKTGILDKAAGGLNSKLQKLGVDANISGAALGAGIGAGAAVAGTALVKFAKDGIDSFLELTAQARAVQRVTGTTAEEASGLSYAFRKLGVDADAAAPAFARFGRNIAEHTDKFKMFGIEIAHTKDGATDIIGTFENAADAVSKMTDPAERDAAALELFGRQGAAMLPILQKGKEGIKDLFGEAGKHHELFSQNDLDNGKKLTLATRELSESLKGLEVSAAKGFAPLITGVAKGGSNILDFLGNVTEKVGGLDSVLKAAGAGADPLIGGLLALGGGGDKATDSLDHLEAQARENIDIAQKLDDRINGEANAAKRAAEEHDRQAKAIDDVINASLSSINSLVGLERSTASGNQAVGEYTTALQAAAAASGQNATLNAALTESTLSAKEALLSEATAAVRLAEDQAHARGETFSAAQQAQVFKDKLIELANHIGGPLHDQLIDLANRVNIPSPPPIVITADTGQAVVQISGLTGLLQNLARFDGKTITTNVVTNHITNEQTIGPGAGSAQLPAPSNRINPYHSAAGRIVNRPILSWLGEEGPEVVIPLNDRLRALQLARASGLTTLLSQIGSLTPGPTSVVRGGDGSSAEYVLHNHVYIGEKKVAESISHVLPATMRANRRAQS